MENDHPRINGGNGNTLQPLHFTINALVTELGVSAQEVQNAIEIVGDDPERVREFIRRNHTETDDTNEI